MNKLLNALCLTSALAVPPTARPSDALAQEVRAPSDGRLMPPEPVTDHVWVMRQPDRLWAAVIGNVVIIEQSNGVVLIDSGGSIADGRDVVAAVSRLTSKPITAVAVTHWHNDHPLGIPGIREKYPNVRIISTYATREFIRTETKVGIGKADPQQDAARRERAAKTIADLKAEAAKPETPADMRAQYEIEEAWIAQRIERQMGGYALLPTETVRDVLRLDDPLTPVELHFYGVGNTNGDLMAWLPRQKVIATGDAVVLPTPYGFTVSTKPWLATLQKVEELPFTILIPGHGKVQRDRAYLQVIEWSMRDIDARASKAALAGEEKDKAFAAFDQTEQRRRFGITDAWGRKWLNDYWLEGMFGTAFDEANGIPAAGK